MAEAAKYNGDGLTAGLQQILVQEEPLLDRMSWHQLGPNEPQYRWLRASQLPTSSFRAVNAGWDADHGVIVPKFEPLAILGGEVEIDEFILDTMGGGSGKAPDIWATQLQMKLLAAKEKWLTTLFEGDVGVDPASFDGLRVRLGGTSADINAGGTSNTDAVALSLEKLDEAKDFIFGGASAIITNQWGKRKINALMRAAGQTQEMLTTQFGQQLDMYAGVPIIVIQRQNDMSSIIGFDEDPGDGGDDAASTYLVKWGEEGVMGILGNGGAWQVKNMGEQQAAPRRLGRLSVYVGLVIKHPRAAVRLSRIGQL